MKRFAISPEALLHMFSVGVLTGVEEGILPGSRFCGFTHDRMSNCIYLFVEHPMYEATGDAGREIPEGPPIQLRDMRDVYAKLMDEKGLS